MDGENVQEPAMTTRIFLADEYQIVRQGLRALLEKETGLEVVGEAASGPAVMRQVQDLAPDIVLLDLGLPELHGGGGDPPNPGRIPPGQNHRLVHL